MVLRAEHLASHSLLGGPLVRACLVPQQAHLGMLDCKTQRQAVPTLGDRCLWPLARPAIHLYLATHLVRACRVDPLGQLGMHSTLHHGLRLVVLQRVLRRQVLPMERRRSSLTRRWEPCCGPMPRIQSQYSTRRKLRNHPVAENAVSSPGPYS